MSDHSLLTFFPGERAVNASSYDIEMMGKAMGGDIIISKTADYTAAKANSAITRKLRFSITDADGNVHTWYNNATYTVAFTASAGTMVGTPTGSGNVVFKNGVADISIAMNATCHNNAAANTAVITAKAILGVTPSGANLTHTITFT